MLVAALVMGVGGSRPHFRTVWWKRRRLMSLCLGDFGSVILQSGLRGRTEFRPVVVCRWKHLVRIQTACCVSRNGSGVLDLIFGLADLGGGSRSRDIFILFVFGMEMVVSVLIVGWARFTASVVVLLVRFSCWWQSGATFIVGDRIVPALMGFTG